MNGSIVRRILPILGITFIDFLGFSILIPLLPYFVKHFGASDITVGLLFSTFAVCQLIAGPVWGNVSDRMGRKAVLIISQIGATIGWALLAFAHSMTTVFLARMLEGASGGNIGVTQAYVADLVEEHERTRAFGYIGAAAGAGFVFGPLLGGFLFERYGFSMPFLAAAGLQLFTLAITILMLPESRSKSERSEVASLKEIFANLSDRRFAPVLWQKLAMALGLYAWFSVISLFLLKQLHFGAAATSYYFAGFGIVNVVLQTAVVGKLSDRFGDRGMSNLGLASLVASFALVPLVHSIGMMIVLFLLFAFGMSAAGPGITSLISRAAGRNTRGTVLSVASSLDNVAGILTPTASTAILQRFGSPWAGALSLLFTALALLLGLSAARREGQRPIEPEAIVRSDEELAQA